MKEDNKDMKQENTEMKENNKKNIEVKDEKKNKEKKKKTTRKKKTIELSKYEELEAKYNELNDKLLRLTAEFDNYRKRTLKEKADLIKTAGEDIIVNILPVLDNFERALKASEDAKDVKAIREGIELIYNNFKDFLKQRGLKEIEAVEQELDTDKHEAITKIPAPKEELKGKIVDVVEKGYSLNDKVIRFAKVVVGE